MIWFQGCFLVFQLIAIEDIANYYLRNVTDQIHLITLANNELKALTSKFMTTFCQLRGRPGGHSGSCSEGSDPLWELSPGLVPWSEGLRKQLPRRAFKGGPVSSLQPGYLPYF